MSPRSPTAADVSGRLRNEHREREPVIRVAPGPQPSTVALRDRTADGQSHAETAGLGREEGLEELLPIRLPRTRAGVLNGNEDAGPVLASPALARDDQAPRTPRHVGHRLDAVHDQIEDELLQLDAIGERRGRRLAKGLLHRDLIPV